jgi:hypothetical protein
VLAGLGSAGRGDLHHRPVDTSVTGRWMPVAELVLYGGADAGVPLGLTGVAGAARAQGGSAWRLLPLPCWLGVGDWPVAAWGGWEVGVGVVRVVASLDAQSKLVLGGRSWLRSGPVTVLAAASSLGRGAVGSGPAAAAVSVG